MGMAPQLGCGQPERPGEGGGTIGRSSPGRVQVERVGTPGQRDLQLGAMAAWWRLGPFAIKADFRAGGRVSLPGRGSRSQISNRKLEE